MRRSVLAALKMSQLALVALVLVLGTAIAGVALLSQPQLAAAACNQDSAPETNILFCGVDGSSASSALSGLKTAYNSNNDGHGNTDIQQVYNAAGFNANMFTSGSWALGTANDTTAGNGSTNIVVNGQVVAKDLQIGSRCPNMSVNCSPASKYTHLVSNVFTRDGSWFFDKDGSGNPIHSVPTLVHLNDKGVADFAMWTPCGNLLKFTAITPPPKSSISCVSLTAQQATDNALQFNFKATAQAENVTISKYTFDFGDNSTPTVVSVNNQTTASTSHAYTQTTSQQKFTAKVTVNDNVTSNSCQTVVTIPPTTPPQQSLACVSLSGKAVDTAQTQFTFTATAQEQNTTIDHFTFQFGDSSTSQTVSTSSTTATVNHTFSAPGTYNIQASVTGPLGTFAGSNCMTSVTVPTPPTPPTLPNTGAGDVIGFFGLTTTLGGLFHHFVIRRKLMAR